RGAPDVDKFAKVLAPELLAGEVEAQEAGRPETGDHPLAVGDAGGRPVRVGPVGRLHAGEVHVPGPHFLAGLTIEAQDAAFRAFVGRLCEEYVVAPDDRGGIAAIGERGRPADVLGLAPDQWRGFFLGGGGAGRAAPRRAALGAGGGGWPGGSGGGRG